MAESKKDGIKTGGQEDFQFIEFSLVPIEWIKKLYPDSWEKYEFRPSNVKKDKDDG